MRISRQHLDSKVETINRITHSPEAAYTRSPDGKLTANIGHFLISSHRPGDRYGTRYALARIGNEMGGESTIIDTVCGAENFADCLSAFIRGLVIGKESK